MHDTMGNHKYTRACRTNNASLKLFDVRLKVCDRRNGFKGSLEKDYMRIKYILDLETASQNTKKIVLK